MTPQLLQEIGLSKSQAITYLRLIEKGALSPPEVSALTGESRSNSYMILNRLEELGLVEKIDELKKIVYQAKNPVALEDLAEAERHKTARVEQQIKQNMPQMLSYFYSFTERPGIRLLQGLEGLREIYADTLRTREDIYFMRTPFEVQHLGLDYFERYKKKRAKLGIKTYAFTQGTVQAYKNSEDDELNKMIRTWISSEEYNAPVEINVYGDKVGFLSYGEEIMGVIIQSSTIAESMRQIFRIVQNEKSSK